MLSELPTAKVESMLDDQSAKLFTRCGSGASHSGFLKHFSLDPMCVGSPELAVGSSVD